jgi:hypothetical protein
MPTRGWSIGSFSISGAMAAAMDILTSQSSMG